MANLLVLGVGPLPFEHGERLHAPGIRTWQLARALAAEHHFVTLCIIDFGDFNAQDKDTTPTPAVRQDAGSNISLIRMKYHPKQSVEALQTLHLATRFAAVVSTTDIMNGVAADLNLSIPLWLDYNGDPFAEKQLQARLFDHDGSLLPQWQLYLKGLARGDRFSVCSSPQRHALIGQLGFAGRLTGANSGEELVEILPNSSRVMSERTPKRTTPLKGKQIPASAFLVIWTGGYNTWCDPELLFDGLSRSMEQSEAVYFATTGGAIDGHDSKSFQIFRELVEKSPLRERFHFLGWIPTDEVGSYYEQADLAVFTDRYSVEGELGTRTRLIDWIQYKVPIACTDLCETTHQLAERGLIRTFALRDGESMATAILDAVHHPEKSADMAERALAWLNEELDEKTVLAPLLAWATKPTFARDRQPQADGSRSASGLTHLLADQFAAFPSTPGRPATAQFPGDSPAHPGSFKQRLRKLFSLGK